MAAEMRLVCLLFLLIEPSTEAVGNSKLLLFLMDGIRWDYLDTLGLDLPGFKRIISQGVQAEYMVPDFPTLSYPNYYSIMTGLHCEDHGMVGNYMYDVNHKEYFLIGTNKEQYHSYWWDDGEPLWVTAEKQNKRAFMYFWPGCEVTIKGVKPTYCEKYTGIPTLSDLQWSMDQGLTLLGNGSADLVGIYVESPDAQGHKYGTSSTQLKEAMTDIDREMTAMMDRLKAEGLDDINVMIFSDHGMTEVSESRVVNISKVVDANDIEVTLEKGPGAYIWPKEGKVDKVYNDLTGANLQHITVYKKSEIPDKWFYRKHYRIPPILLVADEGWYILTPKYPEYAKYPSGDPLRGHHGYNNADVNMRSIFYAVGPDISVGKTIKAFANVHLYQVMCKILGIQPSKNDGDWEEVKGLLRTDVTSGSYPSATVSCLLLTLTIVYGFFFVNRA